MGGGPSLSGFDAGILRGRGRVIAINEAGLTLAPWGDVHFFPDARWLEWNFDRIELFRGRYRVTRQDPTIRNRACSPKLKSRIDKALPDLDIKFVEQERRVVLSARSNKVAGVDGGGGAINMAYLFGVKRIVLLGFDMRPNGNWHTDNPHKKRAPPGSYQRFAYSIGRMVPLLEKHGVEVLNAGPDSALECFPKIQLEEIL